MYITNIFIENMRCFHQSKLDFQYPGRTDVTGLDQELKLLRPNVNLLLGENGSGKTSILRSIALTILAPIIEGAGYVPYSLVRRTSKGYAKEAQLKSHLLLHDQDVGTRSGDKPTGSSVLATRIKRIGDAEKVVAKTPRGNPWERMYDNKSPAILLLGYGAGRRVDTDKSYSISSRRKSRLLRYERVAGLFEDNVTLTPLSFWLPSLKNENPRRYLQVIKLLNQLIPLDCRFDGELEENDYVFNFRGSPVSFPALSDGYRAYIGWVADLLYHLSMGSPYGTNLVDNRGVVLVDEIDLHLHPEWQKNVIPDISATLPNLQFVVTSHSPLVAGTLQSPNIWLMDQDELSATLARRIEENIHGLSAEQILLSSYFGLKTTRDGHAIDELIELSRRVQNDDPDAALEFLRRLSGFHSTYEKQSALLRGTKKKGDMEKPQSSASRKPRKIAEKRKNKPKPT